MFIGLAYALLQLFVNPVRQFPAFVHVLVGGIVFMAGAWNVFWYAARNITQFWGLAALVSGIALMLTGYCIIRNSFVPIGLKKIMPIVLAVLFGCMILYGAAIYRL